MTFTNQPTNVVCHHVIVVLPLVTAFKVRYILVEALALLLRVRSQVLLEFIKMRIKDMDCEGHPAAHCATVLHQSLNQLHIVFGLVIAQAAPNHYGKAVPSCFLLTSELLGEFIALQDHLYLWSDEDTGFDLGTEPRPLN